MISRCFTSQCNVSQSFCLTSKKSHNQNPIFLKSKCFRSPCVAFSSFASTGTPEWKLKIIRCQNEGSPDKKKAQNKKKENEDGEVGECVSFGERTVQCEVEVISWRERRIKAEISVNADVDSVWHALTDYERLSDFIPNLVSSGRIPCPHPGRIWLEQRGLQRALYWHIEARVVLDLQEFLNSDNLRELYFSMVDGDFKKFEGKWSVKSQIGFPTTTLSYEVNVVPKFNFPAIFLERIIRSDLPINLQAIARRSESGFEENHCSILFHSSLNDSSLRSLALENVETDGVTVIKKETKEKYVKSFFGPLSPATGDSNSSWGIFGKSCSLDRPCMVDEVHLRRFDGLLENGGVHRCVLACITVKAPVREVWNVLTSYEHLPEIVPNLVISKVLSRENNKVRILQEGCKGLLYMVLHARVVLDLCESLEQEISFEQVEGDFNAFRGKWILEKLGSRHTLLKYFVESKMHRNSFLSEAIMEEVIYEDLPSNLCAIRDCVETRETEQDLERLDHGSSAEELGISPCKDSSDNVKTTLATHSDSSSSSNSSRQRPKVVGLQTDIEVLKSELFYFISEHGQEGFMPLRKQLRDQGRVDIEKAITRMGGFRKIASLMNLSLAYKCRKPKGYWDSLENLEIEINRFQKNWGMDILFMPSRKSFERAGRYDIARALEKWGGLHEVSRLLSLKVRHPNRISKEKKSDFLGSNNVNVMEKIPSKTYASQHTQKWLLKLKDFDMNWAE